MGLMMAPIGAVIVAEHWLFDKIGLTRYWSKYKGNTTNYAAVITWISALLLSYILESTGSLHLFFLLIPIWIYSTVIYCILAALLGAKERYPESEIEEQDELKRKTLEKTYLQEIQAKSAFEEKVKSGLAVKIASIVAVMSLFSCLVIGVYAYAEGSSPTLHNALFVVTMLYFVCATYALSLIHI